jgi:small-conductance mechanosensitive channel
MGFTLGPVIIVALLAAAVLLVLRPIVQNISSGLILQLRGSCLPGDVVEIAGETGVVQEINARAVVVTTIDGRTVLFPNDEVIAGKLINHSTLGIRRAHIEVRIPGDADIAGIDARIIEALALLPAVLDEPEPSVQVTGFDGRHMWVAVQFWSDPDPVGQEAARDQVGRALRDLFVAAELKLSETTIAIVEPSAN